MNLPPRGFWICLRTWLPTRAPRGKEGENIEMTSVRAVSGTWILPASGRSWKTERGEIDRREVRVEVVRWSDKRGKGEVEREPPRRTRCLIVSFPVRKRLAKKRKKERKGEKKLLAHVSSVGKPTYALMTATSPWFTRERGRNGFTDTLRTSSGRVCIPKGHHRKREKGGGGGRASIPAEPR